MQVSGAFLQNRPSWLVESSLRHAKGALCCHVATYRPRIQSSGQDCMAVASSTFCPASNRACWLFWASAASPSHSKACTQNAPSTASAAPQNPPPSPLGPPTSPLGPHSYPTGGVWECPPPPPPLWGRASHVAWACPPPLSLCCRGLCLLTTTSATPAPPPPRAALSACTASQASATGC